MNTKKKTTTKRKVKEIGNITYTNKNVGFSISIPDNWIEVKKSSYKDLSINDNTLFIFAVDKFTSLSAVFGGFCKARNFNKFYERFNCKDHFEILYTGEEELGKAKVKILVIEHNNKKIMHNFCLINEMIVNFSINLSHKTKTKDKKAITSDPNFKLVKELIETLKVLDPVNPPVYVNYEEEKKPKNNTIEKEVVEEIKKQPQIMVEKDCKYKNIVLPNFYFKYVYKRNNSDVVLSVIDDEIYFKGLNDCFRLIKINQNLSKKIEKIVESELLKLLRMNIGDKPLKSESTILFKVRYSFGLIELESPKNDMDLLKTIFDRILNEIKKETDIDFDRYILFPSKEAEKAIFQHFLKRADDNHRKEKDNKMFQAFLRKVDEEHKAKKDNKKFEEFLKKEDVKHRKEKENREFNLFLMQYEKKKHTEKENAAFQEFLKEYDKKIKVEKQNLKFKKFLEEYENKLRKEKTNEEFRKFLVNYEENIKKEKENKKFREFLALEDVKKRKELEYILMKNSQKEEVESVDEAYRANDYAEEIEEETYDSIPDYVASNIEQDDYVDYDLEDFQDYYHNVDGHAAFKFVFPVGSGEKIVRDFNVFDITLNDELNYRVFLFKCNDVEEYETKLNDWMEKNLESNNTNIEDSYSAITENDLEIKTYILENGRFYKVAYVGGYLISISGENDQNRLLFANIALDNVEIGDDSKSFVEASDRKRRSIELLRAQGIPYIEELPVIESSYEVTGKTLDQIAKRAIVLCIACNFASDILSNKKKRYLKDSKKFFLKLLDTFNVKDEMTKEEKELFDKMDKDLAIQISWQLEGYLILLWTLGLIDEIEFPDVLVDPDSVTSLVSSCDNYKEFIENCELRDVEDVLDLADLTYRYNWYCVESRINDDEPIINPEIVMERHRALNWLLSNEEWDKVEIET